MKRADGCTPYSLAMLTGDKEAAAALASVGAAHEMSPADSFLSACAFGDAAKGKALMEQDPEMVVKLGNRESQIMTKLAELGDAPGHDALGRISS
jgi:hypothetical protein